jgi:hypothetical protein
VERVVKTFEPIKDMDEHTREGFARRVNEAVTQERSSGEVEDALTQEERQLSVEQELSQEFNKKLEGCRNDCWLRATIKLGAVIKKHELGDGAANHLEYGPALSTYCLPGGLMSQRPPQEQAAICADRHAAVRSEFDHFVAPQPSLEDYGETHFENEES